MNRGKRHLITMLAAGAVAIAACGGSTAPPGAGVSPSPGSTTTTRASAQSCQTTELAIRNWTKQMSPALTEFDAIVGGLSRAEIAMPDAADRFDAVALRFSAILEQAKPHTPSPGLAEAYAFFVDGLREMEEAARAAATLTDPPVSGLPAEAVASRDSAVALFFQSTAAAAPCE